MPQILYVNACVRPESRTAALASYVLEKLAARAEGAGDGGKAVIEELRLEKELIFPLSRRRLAFRDEALAKGDTSGSFFRYARQFAAADTIVIAAPYWDLLFPASLRTYLENICTLGVTFRYDEQGVPQTLCRARKLIYVSTAGGRVGTGVAAPADADAGSEADAAVADAHLGFAYVRTLAQAFFHISDCRLFCAQNLDVIGADTEAILAEARGRIDAALS